MTGRTIALAIVAGALALTLPPGALAVEPGDSDMLAAGVAVTPVSPDERMLVESDQLVYDYDNNTVSAVGNVIIYYGGYTLEADKVTYDQTSGRLIAIGSVRLTEPTGSIVRSDYFDVTDDFAEGFVQSLSLETTQRTYFDAASAERVGSKTIFTDGSYMACLSCVNDPSKPPFWKIRAKKIVIDREEQVVNFTDASFEFYGTPVAYLPYFSIADPLVRRKSGFLAPRFGYSERMGFSVATPYYFALAPNYDLTVTPIGYSRQGVLADVEWRHRLENGEYTINAAGIYQMNKDAFDPAAAAYRTWRGGVRTSGLFDVARDWTFGWDGTLSTDRTFTRDYHVLNGDSAVTTSTVHLTGLRDRNYAEARAYYFQVLSDPLPKTASTAIYDQGRQAAVLPIVDTVRISDDDMFGGEWVVTSNLTSLYRSDDDPFTPAATTYYHGTEGYFMRATKEVAWRKRYIGPMGQVVKPFAYLRGDVFHLDQSNSAAFASGALTGDSFAYRAMPAAGLDWSLPYYLASGASHHVIEPRAQLILRPDEMRAGELPNNDAQSLVFDETNLFDHDKFSGFDRTEGGGRLNVGVHYNGSFASGAAISATIGQSYHLFGTNPFATSDLANVGPLSGLENDVSDFVAGGTFDTGFGPRFSARGRFDYRDFSVRRAEFGATTALGPVTTSTSYVFLPANPNTGVTTDSSVIRAAASVNFVEKWRAFGTLTYDVENSAIASDSFGIAFDDESATVSLAYSETRDNYTDLTPDRLLKLRIQLRTLGEAGISTSLNPQSR